MTLRRTAVVGLILGLVLPAMVSTSPAQEQKFRQPKPFYNPASGKVNARLRKKAPAPRTSAALSGSSCTSISFEGLGDLEPIPSFQGISLPDWLSIIENNAGGSGNFANEPSPLTAAFWLNGNPTTQTVQFPNGASAVSFYYASAFSVTVSAYDAQGNLLNTASGAANFDSNTEVFDVWSLIQVTGANGVPISYIQIEGFANYTGIDDLSVCQTASLDSVEITQAIQQYQTLPDLQASLQANQEPPVPIVSGKPAVLRCYFQPLQDVTNVTIHLSGVTDQTKSLALQPNCADADQRAGRNGCQSLDFYFTPPTGSWQAVLDNLDSSGSILHEDVLNVTSRDTNSLRLRGVSVCDARDGAGNWLCADASALLAKTALLSKIAPSSQVALDLTNAVVREDVATFPGGLDDWWDAAVRDVGGLFGFLDSAADFQAGRYTTYLGQVRPALGGVIGGEVDGLNSHGGAALTGVTRLGTETNMEVVAHETGHSLGLRHTNTNLPPAGTAPPGCYNLAADSSTDWPFANNSILEYGFDVAGRRALDPNATFDLMSYCVPRWISPLHYKSMIEALGGGAVTSSSTVSTAGAPFWQVHGVIQNGTVQFSPLFQLTIPGNTGTGSGTYSLLELNAGGGTVFTRSFTPAAPATETAGPDQNRPLGFSQVIPVNPGVTAIVVHDPNSLEIGRLTLGGAPPSVAITAPAAGFTGAGTQTVSWTIQNLNGNNSTSRVLYSANQGVTWSSLGDIHNGTSLLVDFDNLPGAAGAVIQVLVSDGVNTGSATSISFSVPKKQPQAEIDNPATGASQPSVDPVYLSGSAYDVDDGMLSGAALAWSSNLQGALGTGSPLSVQLQPGNHTIQLKATDSDGNSATASVNVAVGGQPPQVGIQATAIDIAPTSCESVTVTAQTGQNGAPLSLVQLSLDGGATYNNLASVPFSFVAPGSGFFHLVARAYDGSGQSNAADATFLTGAVCGVTRCSLTGHMTVSVADVQQIVNEALGSIAAADDLNGDGIVNIVDVQFIINAALGLGCPG